MQGRRRKTVQEIPKDVLSIPSTMRIQILTCECFNTETTPHQNVQMSVVSLIDRQQPQPQKVCKKSPEVVGEGV